jgi:hypothetical protein
VVATKKASARLVPWDVLNSDLTVTEQLQPDFPQDSGGSGTDRNPTVYPGSYVEYVQKLGHEAPGIYS